MLAKNNYQSLPLGSGPGELKGVYNNKPDLENFRVQYSWFYFVCVCTLVELESPSTFPEVQEIKQIKGLGGPQQQREMVNSLQVLRKLN